jgi:hypothetical protein
MCSATDSFDIALAADGVDICEPCLIQVMLIISPV